MVQLAQQNPEVHAEFMKGNFVVQKSRRKFSLMTKDQAHEQSNKILQMKGGAAGLYENHEALMLFMLAGRDWARMVGEFEAIHDLPPYSTGTRYSECHGRVRCHSVASLSEIREVGQTLHAAYTRERLEDSSVPDIINRNNMLTFANRPESDLVNYTNTTLNDPKQSPQWLFVIAGSISVRHVCCIEIQMFQKICITFSFLARAVDQLDR